MTLVVAASGISPIIIVWIVVFIGIFYFMAIRPQRRQRQKHSDMLSMLKKGDEIVTIGGLFGTVKKIGDDWVELEIANRTRVRFLKRAISSIQTEEEEEEYEEEEAYDENEAGEAEDVVEGDAEEDDATDEAEAEDDESASDEETRA